MVLGAIKQIIGAFLGFYLLTRFPAVHNTEPVQQFVSVFDNLVPGWLALTLAVVLVVISQIKINVTNAYSGSLAWTSAWTRTTKRYPGRIIFVVVNLAIALALMEGDMFSALSWILGFYSNFAIAWVVVVATDITFNKGLLKLAPAQPEYRRGMIYNVNPVGVVSFGLAAGLSICAFFGLLGATLALNDMIRMGVTQDWATHMIGHELTALHGLTHGATLAIVINGTLRVLREQKRGKLLQYGERIWGIADGSEEERIDRTLEATEKFFRSLGLSTRLSEEGIGETTIAEIERRFNASGVKYGEAQNVDGAAARRILEACM